jgi:hypothetical protein
MVVSWKNDGIVVAYVVVSCTFVNTYSTKKPRFLSAAALL